MASVTEFKGCPTLSSNGRAQLEKGKVVLQMNKNMRDAYHPQSNPNGNIDLASTELPPLPSLSHYSEPDRALLQIRSCIMNWASFLSAIFTLFPR